MDKTEATSRVAMFGGAGTSLTVWGLQLSEWAALGGLVVAVCGLVLNIWVIRRRDRREVEEHQARMAQLTHPPDKVG